MVKIPENLKGKALTKFLIDNKSELLAQKKSMLKYTEAVSFAPSLFSVTKEGSVVKALAGESALLDADTIRVKVVANTAWWCDSHMDVLLPDCGAKSIKERKGLIPHLHDHIHKLEAKVGDVVNIYYQEMSLMELGINQTGTTQALIFETEIKKSYNPFIFEQYKAGKINQHSIGLGYVKLELAINDEESEKEFDFWKKYVDKVINREYVEDKGYFFVVPEIKLYENSAVLFGSNILTPTLEVQKEDTGEEPSKDTPVQPSDANKGMFSTVKHNPQFETMFSKINS